MAAHYIPSLGCLDERTKTIVRGYIRRSECKIPNEIFVIVLSQVFDHFMLYRGSFQWKISNQSILDRIVSAQNNQKFTSNIFEVGALSWVLNIFPNGDASTATPQGYFMVFLQICSMPNSWLGITMLYTISIEELNVNFVGVSTFEDVASYWGWVTDNLALTDVQNANLSTLTITVSMKILRILQKADEEEEIVKFQSGVQNYKKKYAIRGKLRPSASIRRFSNIFEDIFCVYYDGPSSCIYLKLCGLPNKENMSNLQNVQSLQIQWTLFIPNSDFKYSSVDILEFEHNCTGAPIPTSFVSDDEDIAFEIFVEILTEYDFNGNPIGCKVEEKWNNYFLENDEKQKRLSPNDIKTSFPGPSRIMDDASDHQMQQYFINKKLDQIMDKLCDGSCGDDNSPNMETDESQKIESTTDGSDYWTFKKWLKDEVKLIQYLDILVDNGFDSRFAMTTTNVNQLREIGIRKIGHAQSIMKHVENINFNDHDKRTYFCYYL